MGMDKGYVNCYANLAGWTPLHVAAEGGREAVVEVLLRHKADCSLVTDTGLDDHDDVCFSGELHLNRSHQLHSMRYLTSTTLTRVIFCDTYSSRYSERKSP